MTKRLGVIFICAELLFLAAPLPNRRGGESAAGVISSSDEEHQAAEVTDDIQ